MKNIMIFDIPREKKALSVRVFRTLSKQAKMIQFSVWESEDLSFLMKLALDIKRSGGEARILEEKFLF